MSQHFQAALDSELKRFEEQLHFQINSAAQEATSAGSFGGSRMYFHFQIILMDCLRQFGQTLGARLGTYEAEHTPYDATDFESAMTAIDTGAQLVRSIYADWTSREKPFAGHPPAIEEDRLVRIASEAKADLQAQRLVFASKRSLLKRMRTTFAQKAGDYMITAVLTFIGALLLAGWGWLRQLGG